MPASSTGNNKASALAGKAFFFAILIGIWQGISVYYHNPVILPSPADTVSSIYRIFISGHFFPEVLATLNRALIGISYAFGFGLILGVLIGIIPKLRSLLNPYVIALQSAPVISWLLLALIWFDNKSVPVFIIAVTTAPVIIQNISEGIRNTDPKLLEMAKSYKVPFKKVLLELYFPSILGYLISAFKIVFSLTYRTAVMAEVLSHPGSGIGEKMAQARYNVETAQILAWTFIIIFVAYITDRLFEILIKKWNIRRTL